jgi:hypothetical protein
VVVVMLIPREQVREQQLPKDHNPDNPAHTVLDFLEQASNKVHRLVMNTVVVVALAVGETIITAVRVGHLLYRDLYNSTVVVVVEEQVLMRTG